MTGLRPSTTGLYDNGHWWLPNMPQVVTIPAHFRDHGYRAVGVGKVFHHTAGNHPPNQWDEFQRITFRNDPWFRGVRLNYPWSEYTDYPNGFPFSRVDGLGHENDWGSLPIADADYDDSLSVSFAMQFLHQHAAMSGQSEADPFFLACGLFRPHLPWYVPKKYFDRYAKEDIVLPASPGDDLHDVPSVGRELAAARRSDFDKIRESGRWRSAVHAYLASISFADAQIGQLMDALRNSPFAENTIVVLWSDHGWHLGSKQHWHKSTLWEETSRVPLLIHVPAQQPGICGRPVSLIDLFPTLIDLAGLRAIDSHDGISLTPLLRNPMQQWERPAVIEYKRGNAAVRSDRYRYIRYHDGGEELYDLDLDPHEWNNLAGHQDLMPIQNQLQRWIPLNWADSAKTKKAFAFDPHAFTWTELSTGAVISGMHER